MGIKKKQKRILSRLEGINAELKTLREERNSFRNSTERTNQIISRLEEEKTQLRKSLNELRFPAEPPVGTILRFKHRFPNVGREYTYTAIRVSESIADTLGHRHWMTTSKIPSNLPARATWVELRNFMINDPVAIIAEWEPAPEGKEWQEYCERATPGEWQKVVERGPFDSLMEAVNNSARIVPASAAKIKFHGGSEYSFRQERTEI